ncbi:OprO/OprP family phosphate-selective porin [Desulfuromonas sp. KJ2020]|uniref:selenite/tellurite reduction operon porin ExtI n=1 Tax=Desulfuromonas sp. KJ2020 TaxID=2919173 RepID=UPI0020A7C4DA|nr:selenite/tellurite reduction operon porin ExtI [Desulfuromonas sp. KJ2020]MCP3176833.1 OprO/OprP family phosphate-selective porin [Desulfuromonas sp. KJ2020]
MIFKKTGTIAALVSGLTLLASSAFAGPVWTFGPEEQGLLKLEYKGQFQFNHRDTGAGEADDESANEFNFRRNRLALMGAYGSNFGLYVQTEFNEDNNISPLYVTDGGNSNFQILDAVMRFKLTDQVNVWVGKFKYNLTRENLEACEAPLTLDRSHFIRAPYVSTRDKGVAVWGNLADGMFQYRLDAMNGRNDSDSSPKSNLRYSARGHVTLFDKETGYGYKGTYMGEKKVLTVGAAYQFEPDVEYEVASTNTGSVDYAAWTVDGFFEYPVEDVGTFTLSAAYVDYDLDDAYQTNPVDPNLTGLNGEKNGSYYKAGYMLPNLPLQLFARYEDWSFATLNYVIDQEVTAYAGGFNYYLRGQDLKLTVEYSMVDFDTEGTINGVKTEDINTLTAQLQLIF